MVVAIVVATTVSAPVDLVGLKAPLVAGTFWWISLFGYVLTPIVVIACYGWDVLSQRDGLRGNRDFVLHPGWTRALLLIVAASLVVGAWHVLNLSVPVSEWLGFA